MSKKAQRQEKIENVATKWKLWRRGETGLCGSYFTRRFTAWFVFGLCAAYVCLLLLQVHSVTPAQYSSRPCVHHSSSTFVQHEPG